MKGRVASGLRNGKYTKPERTPRGERHGFFLHPERVASGERNGSAKLTAEMVVEIRRIRATGLSAKRVGAMFGVCENTVFNIQKGRNWASV